MLSARGGAHAMEQVSAGRLWCVAGGAFVPLRADTLRFVRALLSRERELLLVPLGEVVPRARAIKIVPDAQVMQRGQITYRGKWGRRAGRLGVCANSRAARWGAGRAP